jgi:hypothetical protein
LCLSTLIWHARIACTTERTRWFCSAAFRRQSRRGCPQAAQGGQDSRRPRPGAAWRPAGDRQQARGRAAAAHAQRPAHRCRLKAGAARGRAAWAAGRAPASAESLARTRSSAAALPAAAASVAADGPPWRAHVHASRPSSHTPAVRRAARATPGHAPARLLVKQGLPARRTMQLHAVMATEPGCRHTTADVAIVLPHGVDIGRAACPLAPHCCLITRTVRLQRGHTDQRCGDGAVVGQQRGQVHGRDAARAARGGQQLVAPRARPRHQQLYLRAVAAVCAAVAP